MNGRIKKKFYDLLLLLSLEYIFYIRKIHQVNQMKETADVMDHGPHPLSLRHPDVLRQ